MILDSVFSMEDMVTDVEMITVEVAVVMQFEPVALLPHDCCCWAAACPTLLQAETRFVSDLDLQRELCLCLDASKMPAYISSCCIKEALGLTQALRSLTCLIV